MIDYFVFFYLLYTAQKNGNPKNSKKSTMNFKYYNTSKVSLGKFLNMNLRSERSFSYRASVFIIRLIIKQFLHVELTNRQRDHLLVRIGLDDDILYDRSYGIVRFPSDIRGANIPMFTEAGHQHLVARKKVPLGNLSVDIAGK